MAADWALDSDTENYLCVRKTIEQNMHIVSFRPIAPNGTHHTVLTLLNSTADDSIFDCDEFTNDQNMLYGSDVGTRELEMPENVAVTLHAGNKVLLNLHLFNASLEGELLSYSGIEMKLAEDDVTEEEQSMLIGTENIALSQGETTLTDRCQMQGTHTVFAAFPHMHQINKHMRVTLERSGETAAVLLDEEYDFDGQAYLPFETPVEVRAGDHIRIDCTYNNDTDNFVTFGKSSNNEMCYASVFHTPPMNLGLTCTSN